MAGQSEYKQTPNGLEYPYDLVEVGGLVGAPLDEGDSTITYEILNTDYTTVPGSLVFDILAQSPGPLSFYGAGVIINYNTDVFGSNVNSNGKLTCTRIVKGDDGSNEGGTGTNGGNDIYTMLLSDYSSSAFEVDIKGNGYYDLVNNSGLTAASITSFTTLATCSVKVQNCCQTGVIYLAEDSNNSTGSYAYVDNSGVNPVSAVGPYTNVIADMTYNNNGMSICTPQTPSVSDISSDCNSAGSFDVLTINGSNFGCDTGTVYFTWADSSGFIPTYPQDIEEWTDNQIQLLIPTSPYTAASGIFYVQTAAGLNNLADGYRINIGYSNFNKRNTGVIMANPLYNTANFVYLGDNPFIFQLDSTLFNTPGVITTIQHAIAEINCQTGVNFQLDTTAPSIATQPTPLDSINLISIHAYSPSIFLSTKDLAFTARSGYYQSCVNSLSQYNNRADYMFGVDISIINTPPVPGASWLWSDSIYPTSNQYDFATVILHELGHAAMLNHTQPVLRQDGNVMAPLTPIGNHTCRNFSNDANDVMGIDHVLAMGPILGASCPGKAQVFPSGCPTVTAACVPYYPPLGITELISTSSFSAYLYPNPYDQNTVIHIDLSGYTAFVINIYDMVGRRVSSRNIASDTSFDVPLSDFNESAGMYLIQVSDSHNNKILKLIKL
jgi:hypothetical protein